MKRVLFLILITNAVGSFGQSLSQSFGFANELYDQKSYQNAVEAYKRVLFFDSSSVYSKQIFPKIADSFFNLARYQESAEYYDLAYFSTEDSTLKDRYILKKIACFLILKQYDYAEVELLNLEQKIDPVIQKERDFAEAVLRFAKEEYATSEVLFKSLVNDSTEVDVLFEKNRKVDKISPKRAKIMSMIIPGLGQLYVGDIKNGLNSFILSVGLFSLGVRSAIINNPLDAAISTLPWFQRYYQGGFKKAELIAMAKIQEKRYKIYNQLLDEVEKADGFSK
jgi:tetratricopeptide (TPR) repeat protein